MSNSPRNDRPKGFFELLADRLSEAIEEMDLDNLSVSEGDGVVKLSAEDTVLPMPTFTEEDPERLEDEAYRAWKPLAAQLSGAFNALCGMGFEEDQAMSIILAHYERTLWKDE